MLCFPQLPGSATRCGCKLPLQRPRKEGSTKLPFLFYFPLNLCRSPEIVMYKSLAPVSFLSKKNDQESQKTSETCEIITAQSNTSSFNQRNQNLNGINLPLVKFPATWFMAVPLFLAVPNISWVRLEEAMLLIITNQINKSYHHGLFFILVGNDLITLRTSYILPRRPTGYLDVARMHHLPNSLSFFSATLPAPCTVKPSGHWPGYPYTGKS